MCLRSSSRLHSPGMKGVAPANCGRRDDNFITGNPAEYDDGPLQSESERLQGQRACDHLGRQWHAEPQQKAPLPRIGRRNVEVGRTSNAKNPPMEQQYLSIIAARIRGE